MKIGCLSFTERGKTLGDRLERSSTAIYEIHHYYNGDLDGGIKGFLKNNWKIYDGFIFVSSTGIAVRMIHPYIEDKKIDPAVVVVDDGGRFSISLLSGHLGGANELSLWVAEEINAISVITTASDNRNIEAIDLFAKKNDYYMEDMKTITKLTAKMVNGRTIGFYSEDDKVIDYPDLIIIKDLAEIPSHIEGLIIVSSQNLNLQNRAVEVAYLRPQNINIGIGCKKGVEGVRMIEAIENALKEVALSNKSIKAIGTVEVKKDEEGIIAAAKHFNCPMKIFTIGEIEEIEDQFEKSQFVKDTIGVYSVSEPAAYLLGGRLITKKSRHNGITISISKEMYNG